MVLLRTWTWGLHPPQAHVGSQPRESCLGVFWERHFGCIQSLLLKLLFFKETQKWLVLAFWKFRWESLCTSLQAVSLLGARVSHSTTPSPSGSLDLTPALTLVSQLWVVSWAGISVSPCVWEEVQVWVYLVPVGTRLIWVVSVLQILVELLQVLWWIHGNMVWVRLTRVSLHSTDPDRSDRVLTGNGNLLGN